MSIIRFCIEDWKAIFMFVYFPGYGIHLSTIDPKFLMKETLLSTYSWMEVKLMMKVNQRLPRKDFKCKDIEYKNIGQLKKINMDYETCILNYFLENWSKRNRSCFPSVLENYNKCKNFVYCLLISSFNFYRTSSRYFCDMDEIGGKSKINDDIYPAMAANCLPLCTQVSKLNCRNISFIVR